MSFLISQVALEYQVKRKESTYKGRGKKKHLCIHEKHSGRLHLNWPNLAASLLVAGGYDIITLQNILGHKILAMNERYAHLIPDKHQKTREIMQNFWKDSGSTRGYTVSYVGKASFVSQ